MTEDQIITDLTKLCDALRTMLQASYSFAFMVNEPAQKVFPAFVCPPPMIASASAAALRYGLPNNYSELNGFGDEFCKIFGCTHYLIFLLFEETKHIQCSTNCSEEVWRSILGNALYMTANNSTIH
jgi:hypothetical protein